MIKIETVHTNEVFKDGDKIVVKKNNNDFNHKLNYKLLKEFNFVPELINDADEETTWQYIDGDVLKEPSYEDLANIAKIMRTVHTSDIKLPKNNLKQRIASYLRIIHDNKFLKILKNENNWKYMMRLLSQMSSKNPTHNDVWWQNIIKDKNNKLWLIDWEYATMGDKHFDLAYYIESNYLTEDEENVFLSAYNATEDFQAYIPQWMDRYKLLVNWITLIWAYAQDTLPFPLEKVTARINELSKKLYK